MTADAVQQAIVDALVRRAAAQQGLAQQLTLRRAEQLRSTMLSTADRCPPAVAEAPSDALAGLTALVDRLGRAPTTQAAPASTAGSQAQTAPPPLKAVAAYRATWSRLRAEQRLRQALARVPAQAGPLNSQHVVHRALQALHSLSPAYLDAFMLHIDTLLWLDQASGGGERAPRPAARAAGRRTATPAGRESA